MLERKGLGATEFALPWFSPTSPGPKTMNGGDTKLPGMKRRLGALQGFVFLIELVIYAVLVVAYFFFVLHFLGAWLHQLFQTPSIRLRRRGDLLIIGQAVVLESSLPF